MLPTNPIVLLSYINTKLRDNYSSLDDFCDDLDESKEEIINTLNSIGYVYDSNLNQFIGG